MVELHRGDLHRAFNLIGIGKALASEGIAAEQPPPALLQIQPAGAFRDEDMLDARMVCEPGARFQAVMTAEIVCDDENVARRIVRFDVLEELDVVLGIACSGTSGNLLAVADAERPVDPHLVVPATVLQRGLDTMASGDIVNLFVEVYCRVRRRKKAGEQNATGGEW